MHILVTLTCVSIEKVLAMGYFGQQALLSKKIMESERDNERLHLEIAL